MGAAGRYAVEAHGDASTDNWMSPSEGRSGCGTDSSPLHAHVARVPAPHCTVAVAEPPSLLDPPSARVKVRRQGRSSRAERPSRRVDDWKAEVRMKSDSAFEMTCEDGSFRTTYDEEGAVESMIAWRWMDCSNTKAGDSLATGHKTRSLEARQSRWINPHGGQRYIRFRSKIGWMENTT